MQIIISNTSEIPIYKQIADNIREAILGKELMGGEALPSIRGLARDLRISNITTKRAYAELEKEGFIEAVQGKGYFVKSKSQGFLKEEILTRLEHNLSNSVNIAKTYNIEYEEILQILKVLWEEEK